MPTLKGSETEKNLLKAFAGESQARMRYDYFSSQAKKEGLEQISAIFAETAACSSTLRSLRAARNSLRFDLRQRATSRAWSGSKA